MIDGGCKVCIGVIFLLIWYGYSYVPQFCSWMAKTVEDNFIVVVDSDVSGRECGVASSIAKLSNGEE